MLHYHWNITIRVFPKFGTMLLLAHIKILICSSQFHTLLNKFMTQSFLPTINKSTRITHHCATLIDNIYVKIIERNNHIFSGVLLSDLLITYLFSV